MKKSPLAIASLAILSLLCGACNVTPPGRSSSSSSSSSESSSESVSSSSESSSSNSSSEASSEESKQTYTVGFFDGNQLLFSENVEEGECVPEPSEVPVKPDYDFLGWYLETKFETEYDFTQPVTENFSLYANYQPTAYFAEYVDKYSPLYSPFEVTSPLLEGDADPDIVLAGQGVDILSVINEKKILLSGALENLEVTNVEVENKTITIKTKGILGSGKGKIVLAKEATASNLYITTGVDVTPNYVKLDPASIRLDGDKKANFSVILSGKTLNNPDHLNPEAYLAYVKEQGTNLFSVDGEGCGVSINAIHEDFMGFDASFTSSENLGSIRDKLRNEISIHCASELFSDGQKADFHLVVDEPAVFGSVSLEPWTANGYKGKFNIKMTGCRVTDSLRNNLGNLTKEPYNKDLFVSVANAKILVDGLSVVSDQEISGTFSLGILTGLPSEASITLGPVSLGDDNVMNPAKGLFTNDILLPPQISVPLVLGYEQKGEGTYTQSAIGAYKGVKTVVEDFAFEESDNDVESDIQSATEIGKIGFGIVSGDYEMAKNSAGNLLGISSMRNPALLIMESISTIAKALQRIETQLDNIREKLDVIEEELENIGQQTLVSNFMDAYNAWNAFTTDYYVPLVNEISVYTNAYFRYFYDLASSTIADDTSGAATLNLYYDDSGKIAYPADNYSLSVDGRVIDKSATRTIALPKFVHSLAGIRENQGHTYANIESDILVDLVGGKNLSDADLIDIIKTMRFNAMYSYFSNTEKADRFANLFSNFCDALAGNLVVTVTPLDCLAILENTIHNFGFETEADLNLAIIKLSNAYHCAKSIVYFADAVNRSQSSEAKYAELNNRVKKELSSQRFFHPNDSKGNIYCFATSSYVKFTLDAYGISLSLDWEDSSHFDYDVRLVRGESVDKDSGAYNKKNFSSISEADAKLMALRTKVFNTVNGTSYTFKEYLNKIGMIPSNKMDATYGVILALNGILGDSDYDDIDDILDEDLEFKQKKMHKLDVGSKTQTDNCVKYTNDDDFKHYTAIKGKALDIDDGSTVYTGLAALYWKDHAYGASTHGFHMTMDRAAYTGVNANNLRWSADYPICIYSYYVNFAPVD